MRQNKPDLGLSRSVGASVTAVIALLPRIGEVFIVAFVLGAFAAVWFAMRNMKEVVTLNEGAELGFHSGFYGMLAASAIYDLVWQFFHYQLWQIEHLDRLFLLFGGKPHDLFSVSTWIAITMQCIIAAILGGVIGAPSGLLAVKLLQRRRPN